jgi:DNA invertase Pin-like site-specific DNA recombinase
MTVFAGIAEFERDLIRERAGAGREAAKKRGVGFGRILKLTSDQKQLAFLLLNEGKSAQDIAGIVHVHSATIYPACVRTIRRRFLLWVNFALISV